MNEQKEKIPEMNTNLFERPHSVESFKREARRAKKERKQRIQLACAFSLMAVCIVCIIIIFKDSHNSVSYSEIAKQNAKISTEEKNYTGATKHKEAEKSNSEEESPLYLSSEFTDLDYFVEEKRQRYIDYMNLNPSMTPDEIVWRVNANLDQKMYEFDIMTDSYDDPLILVNKYYKVPEGYKPPDLEKVDGFLMRKDTGIAYRKMREAAKQEGLDIRVVSAYRTVEYQRGLYNRYVTNDSKENADRYSARPGYSEHHTGMTMDVFGSQDGLRQFEHTPEYPWLRDNCYKFGFIIRYLKETESITGYEAEPWHIRYIGVEAATDMKNKNINSLEEYHAKYLQNK